MAQINTHLHFDTAEVELELKWLSALLERRGSLPEFAERFREIADLIPEGFEAVLVDCNGSFAAASDVFYTLKLRDPLLVRLSALRAFDLDFDLVG